MLAPLVQRKVRTLPGSPGVYLFRDDQGRALYVGKARNLRSRVQSYFRDRPSDDRYFLDLLPAQLADIETFVVRTEKEAALLENQLIKEHKPRYNVKLRDDKEYLSLRLNPRTEWPRLEVVRRPEPDGARYFGPFHSATAARQTLRLVNRFFQLRTCLDAELRSRTRPCLQYQIRRCPGPCVLDVDRDAYATQVKHVGLFLDGRHDELVDHLRHRMEEASEATAYEAAAVFRDQLKAVDSVRERQTVTAVRKGDQDVLGLFRQADQAVVAVIMVRAGKVVGVRTFVLRDLNVGDDEIVAGFIAQYYAEGAYVPDEFIVPMRLEAMQGMAEVLSDRRGSLARIVVPKRGPRSELLAMATDNAAHAFSQNAQSQEDVVRRLGELQKRLRLDRLPRRIECIDISHTGGQDTVAAIVSLRDAVPERQRYRSFLVKRAAGGDDYGAMYEVLSRRLRRGREGQKGWELPDLVVVDGGKGQLNVAMAAKRDLGMDEPPVVALAKEKERPGREKVVDRVYLAGVKNPMSLRGSSPALQVLALARDEAHRAANEHRRRKRAKRTLRSELDSVHGVGPKTRARLLRGLGSMKTVRYASREDLVTAGATRKQARAIYDAFHPGDGAPAAEAQAEAAAIDNAFQQED